MGKRGSIVITLVAVLLLVGIAACGSNQEEVVPASTSGEVAPAPEGTTPAVGWGIIEIRVTDPPPADVVSAVVYLTNIEVHKVSDNAGEWLTIVGAPPSFDLLDVIGVEAVLGSANITAGSFTQIRLEVDRVEVVTVDGDNITAEVPSGKLKIVRPFNVGGGMTTVLTLDFNGAKSLVLTGKGKALFKPVVKLEIEKDGQQEEEGGEEELEVEVEG